MIAVIDKARVFATRAHDGQVRKYTGEPYIAHPAAVVRLLRYAGMVDEATLAAAWLHDVVEDCDVSIKDIRDEFGADVAALVFMLTDCERAVGNRAARKAKDRERLGQADPRAQSVKLADLIDNTGSIVERDPNFAVTYMREKALLLPLLSKGDAALRARAEALLREYEETALAAWLGDKPHA